MSYIPIIGLEIHVELRTKSKMFCGCPANHFGTPPNTQTCPVCLGLPGALPVPNRQAIIWTYQIGQAFGCSLQLESKFDRKHYFYPDLPKGYQISQYDAPLCLGGSVQTPVGSFALTRIHLEEDTGKLQHTSLNGQEVSLVDFNRSGVPLVEIVSEPVLHSAEEAKAYAQTVRQVINFLGVSDADMEKGSMRLEANISLAAHDPGSSDDPGSYPVKNLPPYKVEVKNINSFNFLKKAIDYEIKRQTALLDQDITPDQETRGFVEKTMSTASQRSKEEAKDYRYFPDPDIPPLKFTSQDLAGFLKDLPRLPADYLAEFVTVYQLPQDTAARLTEHRRLAAKTSDSLRSAQKLGLKPTAVANFLVNQKAQAEKLTPAEIIDLLASKKTAPTLAPKALQAHVTAVVAANPELVAKYRQGKTGVLGALIGEVMKASRGQADPQATRKLLLQTLQKS